ncbi:MAG TPA: class E sortase [Acidimicrobiia bacterium]|nr:class E sortase [Acidimicrobiia bacterium]
MRRALRIAGFTLLGSGGLVLLFLVYQLFITDLINARSQDQAATELEIALVERRQTTTTTTLAPPTSTSTSTTVEPAPVLYEELPGEVGKPLGLITIDKIGLEAVVFEGVDRETLKEGPGHMPWTPVPGQPGNAVISGHRTTYGRPFYDLDQLVPGDRIEVETAVGVSVYEVRAIEIVLPTDVHVTDPIPGAWLTLTTCHPRFSARERLIIQAEMVEGPNFAFVEAITAAQAREVG